VHPFERKMGLKEGDMNCSPIPKEREVGRDNKRVKYLTIP
jgi:hypothetical protein